MLTLICRSLLKQCFQRAEMQLRDAALILGLALSSLVNHAGAFLLPGGPVNTATRVYSQTAENTVVNEPLPPVVEVKATVSSPQELKNELLLLLVGTNRGFNIRERERKALMSQIELLESANPNPRATEGFADASSPLSGNWRLIYTNAIDVLSLGLLPTLVLGRVYQNIDPMGTLVTNVAELQPGFSQLGLYPILGQLGDSSATLKVEASSQTLSPSRIAITFRSARLEPNRVAGVDVSDFLPKPKIDFRTPTNAGYIESTYVDDTIRIGRSPGGSIFVFVRERDTDADE